MRFNYFYKGDLQMNREIDIKLNPVTDGFVEENFQDEGGGYYAFIIATNGEKRFADKHEAEEIIKALKGRVGVRLIGDAEYAVVFNKDKTFDTMAGRYFVGSMLVIRYDGEDFGLIPEEDLDYVVDLLEERMATMVDGEQRFSALEIV